MYVIIDNYDSFVYNLAAYMEELGQEVLVRKNDQLTLEELIKWRPEGIIISPGPGKPESADLARDVVRYFFNKIPMLGVCLGHQIIGSVCGARVEKGIRPMHGKVTRLYHNQTGIFEGIPREYKVTRYHSLVIREDTLPEKYQVDARASDHAVMAISHKYAPVYGVQFHPEAVLTEYGHELLGNFIKICQEWGSMNHEH